MLIVAVSHLSEDAVACDITTPVPKPSYLEVLALAFESRLELGVHPCTNCCTN